MVVLNYTGEEVNAKIVYYGPGLSGKTTNLDYIHRKMPVGAKGKMVSMKTRTDRTLFFDFLPVELGEISGYRTRFLMYTVPGQVYYNATRKLVLKGSDAVVFVADSSRAKLQENIESLNNLEDNLNELGLSLDFVPWVMQYNKRDVPDAMPVEELHEQLNLLGVPAYEATATTGHGIYETFQGIAGLLYKSLKERLDRGEIVGQLDENADPMTSGLESPPPPADESELDSADVLDTAVDSALREVDATGKSPQPRPGPVPDLDSSYEGDIAYEGSVQTPETDYGKELPGSNHEDRSRVQAEGSSADFITATQPPASTQDASHVSMFGSDDDSIDSDVGRTLEFDESADLADAEHDPEEFITGPKVARPGDKEEAAKSKSAPTQRKTSTHATSPSATMVDPEPPSADRPAPKLEPKPEPKPEPKQPPKVKRSTRLPSVSSQDVKSPGDSKTTTAEILVAKRSGSVSKPMENAASHVAPAKKSGTLEVAVPIVLTRSQVQGEEAIPVKLLLEIEIVED